ncbi:MAG: hypothetical protein WC409_05870 [Candidatus Omnitrophota bacterium]|jgi:hypothetical protein
MNWWEYLKEHDVPNWLAIIFTLIVWPLALIIWNKRYIRGIRNLQILIDSSRGTIPTGESCPYLIFRIKNNTGERIYITDLSLVLSRQIRAHPNADRDISTGGYTLKFAEKAGDPFFRFYITIDTQQEAITGFPLRVDYDDQALRTLIMELRNYRRNGIIARYFILQFDCMVGKKHHKVKFKF